MNTIFSFLFYLFHRTLYFKRRSFQADLYILSNQTLRLWAFLTLQLPVQCAEKWFWAASSIAQNAKFTSVIYAGFICFIIKRKRPLDANSEFPIMASSVNDLLKDE
jgi:hypothetical protein